MKSEERLKARELRSQGMSVPAIAKEIGVTKGSVSLWVRDIILTEEQLQRLQSLSKTNNERFIKFSVEQGKQRKNEAEILHESWIKEGMLRAQSDTDFRVIAALYWGEGHKQKEFVISNSDTNLLKVVWNWLKKEKREVSVYLHFYKENGKSNEEIRDYWKKNLTGLKDEDFRKDLICSVNRASQNKKIGKLPYGTVNLRVAKSTKLYFEILGGIRFIQESLGS